MPWLVSDYHIVKDVAAHFLVECHGSNLRGWWQWRRNLSVDGVCDGEGETARLEVEADHLLRELRPQTEPAFAPLARTFDDVAGGSPLFISGHG